MPADPVVAQAFEAWNDGDKSKCYDDRKRGFEAGYAAHRTPTPASGDVPAGWKLVPVEADDTMFAEAIIAWIDAPDGRLAKEKAFWSAMLAASPTPDSSAVSGSAPDAETYSPEDEALYTRWLAGDEDLPILEREQHLRFQGRINRETKERAR